jgi:hypothetical protein
MDVQGSQSTCNKDTLAAAHPTECYFGAVDGVRTKVAKITHRLTLLARYRRQYICYYFKPHAEICI